MQELSQENTIRVPAEILFRKNRGPLFFSTILQGIDVLAVKLLKSGEWMYGLYNGAAYCGYLHFGSVPLEAHPEILSDIMPRDYNDLQNYVNRLAERAQYYTGSTDTWYYIGDLDNRKLLQLKK